MLAAMHRLFSCLTIAAALALCTASGCAYPRHTTPLNTASDLKLPSEQIPGGMYTFQLISATAPETKISGLPWDDDGSGPDLFVRLYVNERMVYESAVIENSTKPEWNRVLPHNVIIPRDSDFRIELWDYDTAVSADPIGRVEHRGLPPTAMPGALARLQLDSATMLVISVNPPRPHRGVGLTVEVRPDLLKVLKVEPFSPAARAGIRSGDQIVGIGSERVKDLDEGAKMSELSLAAGRKAKLSVLDPQGKNERDAQLDGDIVWLVM
jgi:hypothetical protein